MPTLTIIGIDDYADSCTLITLAAQRLARRLNQSITTYVTHASAEALDLLHHQCPETRVLVVLDLHLPGDVDGRLFGSYLREHFPHVAVLPFTADTSPKTLDIMRLNGMHAPVVKPTSADLLAERMAAALQTSAPAPDPALHAFHADIARQMVALVRRGTGTSLAVQIAYRSLIFLGAK